MADVNIVIGHVKSAAQGGPAITLAKSEDISSSGLNQTTTIEADTPLEFAQITVDGSTAVYVAIGSSPDATTTPRARILAGQTRDFSLSRGDKVAVVDA